MRKSKRKDVAVTFRLHSVWCKITVTNFINTKVDLNSLVSGKMPPGKKPPGNKPHKKIAPRKIAPRKIVSLDFCWEGQLSWEKINPEKYLPEKLAPGNLPLIPQRKKKKKKKIDSRKYYLLVKM